MFDVSHDKKANTITVTIKLQEPVLSSTGKTMVVASSHGNQPIPVVVNGKPVILGFNAYIKADKA